MIKNAYYILLKTIRKTIQLIINKKQIPYLDRGCKNADEVTSAISNLIRSPEPCMIARYGAFELDTIVNYLDVNKKKHSIIKYLAGIERQWWWNDKLLEHLRDNAGFFPLSYPNVEQFCKLMLNCSKEIDYLGSWRSGEELIAPYLGDYQKGWRQLIEPFWAEHPWTKDLNGKRVLVVHPFANLMKKQYEEKRQLLFKNPEILPLFELIPLVAVQSIGGEGGPYKDWFEALHFMEQKMDQIDYDVVLIGCGAYGFPLAAHAKQTGHKAIHLAGVLQLLFGIRGKRWDNPNCGSNLFEPGLYQKLFNEYWIYPTDDLKPKKASSVENGCYW